MNLQKGLVAHWTMDNSDISSGTCLSSSGEPRGLNVSNTITGTNSILGEAIESDASGGQTAYIDDDSLDGFDEMTICWFGYSLQEDTGDYAWPITKGAFNGSPYFFADEGNPGSNFRVENTNGDRYNGSIGIKTGVWRHYAVTYSRGNRVRWYNNAEIFDEQPVSDYPLHENTSEVRIMDDGAANSKMRISDMRIYSRSLSQEEISALYNMRSQRHASV